VKKCNFKFYNVVQTLVSRRGKLLYHRLIAYFLQNMTASNYYNPAMHTRVTGKKCRGSFFRETVYIFVLCFMSRPSFMKSSILLCYNINKLTYLLTYLLFSIYYRSHHTSCVAALPCKTLVS